MRNPFLRSNPGEAMRLAAALAAACVPALAAFAGAKMIDGSYVQSGLVARWDAIDNAGTGTHDPAATVWKDLVGGNDLTIVPGVGSAWTNGNAFYMNTIENAKCPAYGNGAATDYRTIEIVYKKAPSKGRLLFCGGDWTRYVAFDYVDTAAPWAKAKVYFDGCKSTLHTVVSNNVPTSLVALYGDGDAVVDIYRDGATGNAGSKAANQWSVDENSRQVRLGCRGINPDSANRQGWEGEVYTIRLYDRALTAVEISRNYTVDAVRFFGETFATNVIVATAVEGLEGAETPGLYAIDGDGHVFTAPAEATKDGAVYACTGYTIETWKGAWWSAPVKFQSTSYAATDASAKVRLTWQWQYVHGVASGDLVPFTSASYEQSGLVAQWDAIDNAGTGTHDPGATMWKDLKGGNNLVIAPNLGSEWRRGSAFYMDTVVPGIGAAYSVSEAPAYKTMEISFTQEKHVGTFLLYGGDRSRIAVFGYATNGVPLAAPEARVHFDGSAKVATAGTPYTIVKSFEPTTLTAVYDDGGAVSGVWRDGEDGVEGTINSTWNASQKILVLGYRSSDSPYPNQNQGWAGEIYSIRLYDRALTPAEVARNRMIDEARFFGRLPVTNVVVASSVRGIEGDEPEGAYMLPDGGHVFTAPAVTTLGDDEYSCDGYTLETWDGSAWGLPAEHGGETSCALHDKTATVRLTWRWSHTAGPGLDAAFGDYVADGLVLQLDGVRNIGPRPIHSPGAAVWADLSPQGGLARLVKGGPKCGWAGDGYFFDGTEKASYAAMNEARALDGAYTVQVVADFDPYASARLDSSWPAFVGTAAADDRFALFCNQDSVASPVTQFRVAGSDSGFGLSNGGWRRVEYMTALFDGSQVALFEEPTPSSRKAFSASPGRQVFTFGSGEGGDRGFESRKITGTIKAIRFYDRALSDAELRQNRAVDEARFFRRGASSAAGEVVVASSVEGLSGDLPCGAYRPAAGYEFTAPAEATLGGTVYELAGYTLETWNGSAWGSPQAAAGTSVAPDVASASKRLTWNWVVKSSIEKIGYDVGDYVQDGLYLHLDGIRNAGADAPHDYMATWVNLGSGGPALNATFDYAKSASPEDGWAEDGYYFVNGGKFAKLATDPAFGCFVTIEVVCDVQDNGGSATWPALFGSTNDLLNIYCNNDNRSELRFKVFNNASAASGTPARGATGYKAPGGLQSLAAWGGKYATAMWACGKYQLFQSAVPATNGWAGTWHYNENTFKNYAFYIGGIYLDGNPTYFNSRRLDGKVQAVRVYNRSLSDEELAKNRRIDDVRFKGGTGEANVFVATRFGDGAGEVLAEGVGSYKVGGVYTFSATEVKDEHGRLRKVGGCMVEELSGEQVVRSRWNPGRTFTYDEASGKTIRLTWCPDSGFKMLIR